MSEVRSIAAERTSNLWPKPSLAVLYGQPEHLSTSFQTRQLTRALERWFTPLPLKIAATGDSAWRRQLSRLANNYLRPLITQPETDYLLYANDGLADLQHWRGKRLLYWYDAAWNWAAQPPQVWQWPHWLRYRNVINADYVFAVSRTQADIARRLRPGREETVNYLPVGVDCHFFDPRLAEPERVRARFGLPDKTIIGYLGYIGVWAGRFAGELLVEVAPQLLAECDLHFLVVGFGPGLERFQQKAAALGLTRHFTFTGFVPDELVPSCLAAMDVCVDILEPGFHSEARSETKLKQYMAMGRACVATAIGENCVDLDEGRCGALVPPGPDGLLDGILSLCQQPRVEFGRAARKRAEQIYDWPKLAARLAAAVGLPVG